ncbi:uncharacterized protein IL334_006570 [Kwoniella shivajii]|uniref:ATP-dependent DNA ligase family profile domain-containing protein n=1 Tax=Kwoniella shivajii TaxID=564305 RepID=A0ABZ1D6B0_9TREE|nr:hypothetical protein IL334_006570 [Kwoniella shivajii]
MDIPFESFAKLVYHLGNPPRSKQTNTKPSVPLSPNKIFKSWLNHLPKPFAQGAGKHLFRLLFPHEGSSRRYGLKENKLAQELERCLGLRGLTRWDCVSWDQGESGTGCLGREVEILMRDRNSSDQKSTLSIRQLDALLDELAAPSPFSQLSQLPSPCRSPQSILSILYRESNMTPYALAVLTQVILRDLRPLLNPLPRLPVRNPTTMLRMKTTIRPDQLTLREAMIHWNKRMWEFYNGGRGDLDECADLVESLDQGSWKEIIIAGPVIGTNVRIPKCKKGRSISDALNEFTGTKYAPPAEEIWAETKYDGYRLQIHVEFNKGRAKVTVFSKSTRDSSKDRLNMHSIVLASLEMPVPSHLPIHPTLMQRLNDAPKRQKSNSITSVILEAEVVPYNESSREGGRGPGIEEFWWLGDAGVTASAFFPRRQHRHLCLVFFDVLLLDGQSMLHRRYEDRRAILEQVVKPVQGFSMLSERKRIDLGSNRHSALKILEDAFQRSSERREEGLVLKASSSTYTNMKWQWVKLKKDYIPNLGDCIDLVLLGAGWDIDRARDLRVDTSVFTTFYLGVLTNSARVTSHRETPHFEILFRVSYGPDRAQLEYYNECIRHGRWSSKPFDKDDPFKRRLLGLSWNYTLQKGMIPPSVLFEKPMCAEVMGAGFQKLPESNYFEVRWPRLQKIFEPSERTWVDALSSSDLIRTAHHSLGYEMNNPLSPYSPPSAEDSIRALWRSHSTINLIDIPILVSPKSPRSPKRNKSESNLILLARNSPLTPIGNDEANNHASRGESGRRLREMMSENEGLDLQEHVNTPRRNFDFGPALPPLPLNPDRTDDPSPRTQSRREVQDPCPSTPPARSAALVVPIPQIQFIPTRISPRKVTSPVKRLISSIDWSTIDLKNQSTPNKKKKKVERKRFNKPLSLKSRLKLATRRIGVKG